MAKITEIMADMDKVEKGRWVDYAAGIKLLIANINNSEYRKARHRILKPYLRNARTRSISSDEVLELLMPAVANYVLLGWKNIEDEKGKAIKYSTEKALEFLKNPALADLYSFVLETAGEIDFFRKEDFEDSVKNSVTASDGN